MDPLSNLYELTNRKTELQMLNGFRALERMVTHGIDVKLEVVPMTRHTKEQIKVSVWSTACDFYIQSESMLAAIQSVYNELMTDGVLEPC